MIDQELDLFKTSIDLRAFAAGQGYSIDRRESWRGSSVMRHPDGDKLIVKLDNDGHYIYFSVRDDADNGTIIDFVQNRLRLRLGEIRKVLRPWLGRNVDVATYPALRRTAPDRLAVEAAFARMDIATRHPYLEEERALTASLLQAARFAGRIRKDVREGLVFPNVVFPHFDQNGLCGYEIKNRGFTGFARGGSKGLWLSRSGPEDNQLVFCESAIDALSHSTLFPMTETRYASIGGKLNPEQPGLVMAAIVRMPHGSEIVAAMDADAEGNLLNGAVRQALELSGRSDLRFVIHEPAGFKDWNDQLRMRPIATAARLKQEPFVVCRVIRVSSLKRNGGARPRDAWAAWPGGLKCRLSKSSVEGLPGI